MQTRLTSSVVTVLESSTLADSNLHALTAIGEGMLREVAQTAQKHDPPSGPKII